MTVQDDDVNVTSTAILQFRAIFYRSSDLADYEIVDIIQRGCDSGTVKVDYRPDGTPVAYVRAKDIMQRGRSYAFRAVVESRGNDLPAVVAVLHGSQANKGNVAAQRQRYRERKQQRGD